MGHSHFSLPSFDRWNWCVIFVADTCSYNYFKFFGRGKLDHLEGDNPFDVYQLFTLIVHCNVGTSYGDLLVDVSVNY